MPENPVLPTKRFCGGRINVAGGGPTSRYDVFRAKGHTVPDDESMPNYLGVVVGYADGRWVAVARNGWKGEAKTRRDAARRAWWFMYA